MRAYGLLSRNASRISKAARRHRLTGGQHSGAVIGAGEALDRPMADADYADSTSHRDTDRRYWLSEHTCLYPIVKCSSYYDNCNNESCHDLILPRILIVSDLNYLLFLFKPFSKKLEVKFFN